MIKPDHDHEVARRMAEMTERLNTSRVEKPPADPLVPVVSLLELKRLDELHAGNIVAEWDVSIRFAWPDVSRRLRASENRLALLEFVEHVREALECVDAEERLMAASASEDGCEIGVVGLMYKTPRFCSTDSYRAAPGGDGALAAVWADKPHRLVYDLCRRVDDLDRRIDAVTAERDQARKAIASFGESKDFDWNVLGKIDDLEIENARLRAIVESM